MRYKFDEIEFMLSTGRKGIRAGLTLRSFVGKFGTWGWPPRFGGGRRKTGN